MQNGESGLVCRVIFLGGFPPAFRLKFHCEMECLPPGVVKLNFDGPLTHHSAAGRFIIRDWSGQLLKAGAAHYGNSGILVTEARALRDGVKAAAHLGIKHLQIEGDNATVIRTLRGEV